MVIPETEIQAKLRSTDALPAVPAVVREIVALVDREADIKEIAETIARDQVISARILQMVNSPLYGFPGRISSISHAVILLGVNVIRGLAVSIPILDALEKKDRGLWLHSIGSAAAAQVLARELVLPEPEEMSTASLLHDIGRIFIKSDFPEEYEGIRALMEREEISMFQAEQRMLGMDHAAIGGELARRWHLPDSLVEPIVHHHEPAGAKNFFHAACVVHAADVLIKTAGYGNSGDAQVEQFNRKVWDALELDREKLKTVLSKLDKELARLEDFGDG